MRRERGIANRSFDFIVIGAGASGCIIATRLADRSDARVLLLEAGPSDDGLRFRVPMLYYSTIDDEDVSWRYLGAPELGLNDRTVSHPRGKVLGGCTSTNGLVYIRGARSDFDEWAKAVCDDRWAFRNVLPLFKQSERNVDIRDEYHGADGEVEVAFPRYRNAFMDAFEEAAVVAGIPRNPDFNGVTQDGVGRYQLTAGRWGRSSTSRAFLRRCRSEVLFVKTNRLVTRIRIERARAVGVDVIGPDGPERYDCSGEIVLCAGAFNSPKILQLSGIGPEAVLRRLGIKPLLINERVGAGLQDHLQVRLLVETAEDLSMNALQRNRFRQTTAALQYAFTRSGDLSIGAAVAGLFARSQSNLVAPDIQVHVIPFSAEVPGRLHGVGGATVSVCSLRPTSRGSVEATSSDPRVAPRIHCNYLGVDSDILPLRHGLRLMEDLLWRAPLAGLIRSRLVPRLLDFKDQAALDFYVRSSGTTIFHPACTCAMGPPGLGVVNSTLSVHGVDALRVADASIMPAVVSGNTSAACMMIGERAAQDILEAMGKRGAA